MELSDSDSDSSQSKATLSLSQLRRDDAQIDTEIRHLRDQSPSIDELLKTQPDTVS